MADHFHPNDTLNGKLLEHEREEDKHLRGKFGYWRMVEERVIREQLIAEGHDPNTLEFVLLVLKQMTANHANDISLRDQQAQARANAPKAPVVPRMPTFTEEELRYMAEQFEMANNPIGVDIYAKVSKFLENKE